MKSNRDIYEELLRNYKKQKADNEQIEKAYKEVSNAWWKEVEANGDRTEKATALGVRLDKITSDLDKSREEYNYLAHEVLKFYMLL